VVRGQKNSSFASEALAFVLGLVPMSIGMLFCAWGVVVPNATIRRKVRGEKKLKPHAVWFEFVEIFLSFYFVIVKVLLGVEAVFGLALTYYILIFL